MRDFYLQQYEIRQRTLIQESVFDEYTRIQHEVIRGEIAGMDLLLTFPDLVMETYQTQLEEEDQQNAAE